MKKKKDDPHSLSFRVVRGGPDEYLDNYSPGDLAQAEDTIRYLQRLLYQTDSNYNKIFDSLDEGFCIVEVLPYIQDEGCDYRFLKINKAFIKLTGVDLPWGRTMREIANDSEWYWFTFYDRIALTEISQRFEYHVTILDKYFDVFAFRLSETQIAILFNDVSERKRHQEKQEFMLMLSDRLRPVSDPYLIQDVVTKATMEFLHADRCFLSEIGNDIATVRKDAYEAGLATLKKSYCIKHFPLLNAELKRGKPLKIADIRTSEVLDRNLIRLCVDLEIISFITIPIIKEGIIRGLMCVCCRDARSWTDAEVSVLQETADRTWGAVEQAVASEKIRASEEKYRMIVDQSIAGILTINRKGDIIFSNEQFCNMIGYSVLDITELSVEDLILDEDRKRNLVAFERLSVAGKPYVIEQRLVRKDKAVIWVNNHLTPIFSPHGIIEGASIISIDVTRQKELERQKDEFIGIASHELKTPLTSIKGYGDMIQRLLLKSESLAPLKLVDKMNGQISRLIKLVYSLLDTTQITGGHLVLQPEKVNLNELIEEHLLQEGLKSSLHHISFQKSHLPVLYVDPERIGQVIDNLISNAIKYSPSGGRVRIYSEMVSDRVRVTVRDEGPGVPLESVDRVFERFYRVRSESSQGISGIGLGLYICREIMERHRGTIGLNPHVTQGAEFYFELPHSV